MFCIIFSVIINLKQAFLLLHVMSAMQWHYRLGHTSLKSIKLFVPSVKSVSQLHCESYQFENIIELFFLLRQLTNVVLHLKLFILVFGVLLKLKLCRDFSYFVTFIDDYSHMIWVYLMKDHSEILSIFQKLHKDVSTQFNCSLNILRSDNALEYVQHALQNYFLMV